MPALAAAAYLLGGVPTGYLLARRLRGIDIRLHGSGNPGAANTYRVVGAWAGLATLIVDALKGFLPVVLARHLYPDFRGFLILCGAMAIFGHLWTPYLGFKGGKGVATSAGVFAALLPAPTLASAAVFILAVSLSGHISVGSMLAALAVPAAAWLLGAPQPFSIMASLAAALILYKHLPNLRRLLRGREPAARPAAPRALRLPSEKAHA